MDRLPNQKLFLNK